eukprot:PhM_4_TR380/c0_g1_i1/m.104455
MTLTLRSVVACVASMMLVVVVASDYPSPPIGNSYCGHFIAITAQTAEVVNLTVTNSTSFGVTSVSKEGVHDMCTHEAYAFNATTAEMELPYYHDANDCIGQKFSLFGAVRLTYNATEKTIYWAMVSWNDTAVMKQC